MPGKTIKHRRGTVSAHSSFTPSEGEITMTTDRVGLRVGDGSTAGGIGIQTHSYLSVSVAGSSNVSLTESQSQHSAIVLTGVLTGNIVVTPSTTLNLGKIYSITNSTTGSYTVTIGTAGVVIPQGYSSLVYYNGTTYAECVNGFSGAVRINSSTASSSTITGSLITAGGVGIGGALYVGGVTNATATTEATTGGAGSIVSLGGIYATKAIVSGSATDSTTTATGGAIFAGGVGIGKTLTTSARILTTAIKTTTYTILTTDHVIICNHASTAFTVTLPSLVSATTGRQYIIKNKGAAIVTVDANGSETIDGNLSVDLALYESITVVNDGTQWLIV